MPTYHYICKKCGFELDELQLITEPPLVHCPNCKTDNLVRTLGKGAGLIFKGSGFYLTDYKNPPKPPGKEGQKKETKEGKPPEKKKGKAGNPPKNEG